MDKSYYEILQISKNATQSDIKKSYYKLAKKCHPDKNPGNKKAEEQFKQISEAFQVLGDVKKRDIYNKFGKEGLDGGHMNGFNNSNVGDIFSNLFGNNKKQKKNPVKVQVKLEMEDIFNGKKINVSYSRKTKCNSCKGTGSSDCKDYKCTSCKGSGRMKVTQRMGPMVQIMETLCNICNGSGNTINKGKICNKCDGKRFNLENINKPVEIPRGMKDEEYIIIENEGHQDLKNDTRSDLVIFIKEKEHKIYKRGFTINNISDPYNLLAEIEIDLAEALCGFTYKLKGLDLKYINIVNESIIKPDTIKVIRNKGMIRKDLNGRGDLFLKINIKFPIQDKLTNKNREKLWEILSNKKYENNLVNDEDIEFMLDMDEYSTSNNSYDEDEPQMGEGVQCHQQ
jgi:DnaJ homolog subfamily A member 2